MFIPPRRRRTIFTAAALLSSGLTSPALAAKVDLVLTQAAYTSPAVEGEPIVFGVQVANAGAKKATEVTTRTELPDGVIVLSADPGCTVHVNKQRIKCRYGSIPPNGGAATRS